LVRFFGRVPSPREAPARFAAPTFEINGLGRQRVALRFASLPQYSTGLNPIGMQFSKLTALVREAAERTILHLRRRIGRSPCTAREARSYFRHIGHE
jgi:hypothetical protein